MKNFIIRTLSGLAFTILVIGSILYGPVAFAVVFGIIMIYSASSCLITDLYYGYEKGRFDFDFFAEAVVLGKTIFKSSPMRGCGGGGPGKMLSNFVFFL